MKRSGTRGIPRADRESSILDAAVAEFGRHTYAGARVDAIAADADVSKTLILRYFDSKEQLYIACVKRAGDNLTTRIDAVLHAGEVTLTTAADTLAAIFAGLEPRPHDWTLLNDQSVEKGSLAYEAARGQRDAISAQGVQGIAALLADTPGLDDIDADDIAVLTNMWTAIVTSMVQWWLHHPDNTAAQMTARSYRLVRIIAHLGATVEQEFAAALDHVE